MGKYEIGERTERTVNSKWSIKNQFYCFFVTKKKPPPFHVMKIFTKNCHNFFIITFSYHWRLFHFQFCAKFHKTGSLSEQKLSPQFSVSFSFYFMGNERVFFFSSYYKVLLISLLSREPRVACCTAIPININGEINGVEITHHSKLMELFLSRPSEKIEFTFFFLFSLCVSQKHSHFMLDAKPKPKFKTQITENVHFLIQNDKTLEIKHGLRYSRLIAKLYMEFEYKLQRIYGAVCLHLSFSCIFVYLLFLSEWENEIEASQTNQHGISFATCARVQSEEIFVMQQFNYLRHAVAIQVCSSCCVTECIHRGWFYFYTIICMKLSIPNHF